MSTSLVYRSAAGYEAVMRVLYGPNFRARYEVLADLVPDGASVVDVCCGPPILYKRWLQSKGVEYTGLDVNARYVRQVRDLGARGELCDVRDLAQVPDADVVIMQASLYHFLPNARVIVDKLFAAARNRVIIAEPVRNVSRSRIPLVGLAAQRLSDAGNGAEHNRFTESTLDALLEPFAAALEHAAMIPGGREKIFAFRRRA